MLTGLGLGCHVETDAVRFDRKNYPYPDLMKGYQIWSTTSPSARIGYMDVEVDGRTRRAIRINRVHLEEDTARLLHRTDGTGEHFSLLDVNRAGMPLMEIVTEPDARSPEGGRRVPDEAATDPALPRRQRRRHGAGQLPLRAQPQPASSTAQRSSARRWSSRTSTASAPPCWRHGVRGRAPAQDPQRGRPVPSETRGWREETAETASQRSKEQAHDYRYFPEPDLPPLGRPRRVAESRARLPELRRSAGRGTPMSSACQPTTPAS